MLLCSVGISTFCVKHMFIALPYVAHISSKVCFLELDSFFSTTYLMCQAMYLIVDLLYAWHIFLNLFNEKKHDKGKCNMLFFPTSVRSLLYDVPSTTISQMLHCFFWISICCKVIRLQFDVKSSFSVGWTCTLPLICITSKCTESKWYPEASN